MTSRWHAAALAGCFLPVVVALPHRSGGHSLEVPGRPEVTEIAVTASGHQHVEHAAGNAQAHANIIRTELGELFQSKASVDVNLQGGTASAATAHQPASQNLTGHPPTLSVDEAKSRLEKDGLVETYNAVEDQSQRIKLEEETIECMMDTPVWECMEKHGSYGVRRLFTDNVAHYDTLENWRRDWMAEQVVQKKRLFDITWPGTHDSGAYGFDDAIVKGKEGGNHSVKGALTQHLDVFTQLSMGVRAIDLQVAVGKEDGQLYTANGFLMMSLATVLTDITSFLTSHKSEVILLYMRKADVWNGVEDAHIQPLKDEESNPNKIPGEAVHKGVEAILGEHLATYTALTKVAAEEGENAENPTIQAALAQGIRVFYFWEGQQVLCLSRESCLETPGWQRGTLGQPLAFGPGLPYGARTNLDHGVGKKTYIEPGCIMHSSTATTNPIQLLLNEKKYAGALMNAAEKHPPSCFPGTVKPPELHHPQLFYEADLWVSPFTVAAGAYRQVYKDIQEIYTRGESATMKSEAERVNFLALNWLLRKNWQPLFTKLNIISFDFIAPITVHRIIEANQEKKECGFAIYCKGTGSCWAKSMLDDGNDSCKNEHEVMEWLRWFSDGQPWAWWFWALGFILVGIMLKITVWGTVCYSMGNDCCPTCCFPGGMGIVWFKRKKVETPKAVEEAAQGPEQQTMDNDVNEEPEESTQNEPTAQF